MARNGVVRPVFQRLRDGIGTNVSEPARRARLPEVERIDERHQRFDVLGHIGHEAGLEVSLIGVLGAQPGPREIGRADEGRPPVDDHGLGMNARA